VAWNEDGTIVIDTVLEKIINEHSKFDTEDLKKILRKPVPTTTPVPNPFPIYPPIQNPIPYRPWTPIWTTNKTGTTGTQSISVQTTLPIKKKGGRNKF
jgi:hypothetical protein